MLCAECGQSFTDRAAWAKHMKSAHQGEVERDSDDEQQAVQVSDAGG